MDVLFITSNRLGDAVLSTGLLDHIIKNNQDARITVACGPLAASLFEGMPNLKSVIVLKKEKFHGHWFKLLKQSVGIKWDIVVDLRDSAVSRLVFAKKRYIFSNKIDKSLHKVEQAAKLMNLDHTPSPCIWVSKAQKERVDSFNIKGQVLAIGPTANWIGKTWPYERFIELVSILTAQDGLFSGAQVAVFAAPGEERDAYKVLDSVPKDKQIDVIAKVDPGTAAAILSECALYIGNDSGLMHCAAAAGTPTVGLFGPSYPHIYRPWGDHTEYVRTDKSFDELIDFKGYDPKTLDHSLMTSLTLENVVTCTEQFWKSRKQAA